MMYMKKIKKYVLLILLIVVGSFLCIYGVTFAKYVANSVWDYYLKSKGFYFSSDYLGSSTIKNADNLWDGGSVPFNIKNNLNDTVMTDYDIDYRIACTITGEAASHTECHLNGTTSNIQDGVLSSFQVCVNNTENGIDVSSFNKTDCELGGYDWENQVAIKDLYFDVVLTDTNYELKDVTVNITATSIAPYHKVLSGDFALHKNNTGEAAVDIDYKNYTNYDRLIISNSHSIAKCIRVTWDANKLLIDADNNGFSTYGVDSNGYINEIKLNINAKSSLSYIFHNRNFGVTYDVSEFNLEETSGC